MTINAEYMVVQMNHSQLSGVVDVHVNAFPDFFLTRLGRRSLAAYYKSIISFDDSICLSAVTEDDRVVGFCVGTKAPSRFLYFLVKRWMIFFLPILQAFLRDPSLFVSLVEALVRVVRGAFKVPGRQVKNSDKFVCELTSIGVLRGLKGVGSSLVDEFLQVAAADQCTLVRLTTDKNDNDKVIQFYGRKGFNVEGSFRRSRGREMLIFTRNLSLMD